MGLGLFDRLHQVHRRWRIRFKSEVPTIRYILNADLAGTTMVDVGARYGTHSFYMSRKAGPDGQVFAFEPQPELGRHLLDLREAFHLDNLEIVNKGLSTQAGEMILRRVEPGSGGASFEHGADGGLEEVRVQVTTLDECLRDCGAGPVSFIKSDVEGHELEVFQGGREILERDKPALIFECRHNQAADGELFGFLTDLGYDGFFFWVSPKDHRSLLHKGRGRYIHYTEFDQHPYPRPNIQLRNYLFVPSGQPPRY
ncbi:MAG: FkbM family methyltransferase [Gammaproteobacteria bacterium]|nr:FkbM family methyltransferase [Gammaproteobacteria bacterium]